MDSELNSTAQEDNVVPQEPSLKPPGYKRKFVSQSQFENLLSTVAYMRSEMVMLISLFKESLSPAKKACLDDSSQSTRNPMLIVLNEKLFLNHTNGNQFAIPSYGDQIPAAQMPSGSLEFGLAMPLAPDPALPMAQIQILADSAEGNFVPILQNIEGEISNTAGQRLLADSAIHFVEDESLGPKISQSMLRTAAVREF